MSNKPSLYVVERKEVVVLVVLFVLVTVLAFTMGVKYGQSMGRKLIAKEQQAKEQIEGDQATATGGSLSDSHGSAAPEPEAEKGHGKSESHGKAESHGDSGEKQPEAAEPDMVAALKPAEKAALQDTNSDEYLLNALKESGIEGQSSKGAKLPEKVKTKPGKPAAVAKSSPRGGAFVIQVGSHPVLKDAERQLARLKARKLDAHILPATRDRQGEWHRVVVGSYSNKNDAEKEAKVYKDRGIIGNFFVRKLN